MPGLLDSLGLKRGKSSVGSYLFGDLLKSDRKIEGQDGRKDRDGNLVYNLKMILLKDNKPAVEFPAVATISQTIKGESDKINLGLKLPSTNYGEDKKLVDVDTTAYQGVPNNKQDIEKACWKCFDEMNYDQAQFAKWFAVDDNRFNFNSEDDGNNQYIHDMSFIYQDEETGEQSEVNFRMAVEPEQDSKETVTISFEYPDPKDVLQGKMLVANGQYTGVENKHDAIIRKVQHFLNKTYGVDSVEKMPNNVAASNKATVTLKKIQSSTGYDIHLQSVSANYKPELVLADIDALVANDTFVDELPVDTEVVYEFTSEDDGLDVETIEETNLEDVYRQSRVDSYRAILDAAYLLKLDNEFMGYIAAGPQMSTIQNYTCNYQWRTQEIIDAVSKMVIEENFILEHPVRRMQRIDNSLLFPQEVTSCFWKDFVWKIMSDIQGLVDALNLYMVNLTSDKQQQMCSWVRAWTHEIDYCLKQSGAVNPIEVEAN